MNNLCEYGCGLESKFITSSGKRCCSTNYQGCSTIKAKNSDGKKKNWEDGVMIGYTDVARLKSRTTCFNKSVEKAFVENSTYSNEFIKPKFIKLYANGYACNVCSISEWNNKPIVLELDHIDGNNRNNLPTNLRLLCPNCHSQTPTFRGRNINNGLVKVSDEDLIEAIRICSNTRLALIKVGLSPKGANYARVKKIKEKYNI